ncbi:RNA polymerase sigma factor [Chloroflexota bacterium]
MKMVRNKGRDKDKAQETARTVTLGSSENVGLVERAIGGDLKAFGELYSSYLEPIYRYVFYHVKDRMTAEDVTEEVFIKAWKGIRSCKGKEQTFSAWLYRIAHNHVVDYFRSSRQKHFSAKYSATEMDNTAEVDSPETEVDAKLEWQELLEKISYLPQNQKQVIILKFTEGLDNREIMDKSPGAIRVLQMRALAKLRRSLGGEK